MEGLASKKRVGKVTGSIEDHFKKGKHNEIYFPGCHANPVASMFSLSQDKDAD